MATRRGGLGVCRWSRGRRWGVRPIPRGASASASRCRHPRATWRARSPRAFWSRGGSMRTRTRTLWRVMGNSRRNRGRWIWPTTTKWWVYENRWRKRRNPSGCLRRLRRLLSLLSLRRLRLRPWKPKSSRTVTTPRRPHPTRRPRHIRRPHRTRHTRDSTSRSTRIGVRGRRRLCGRFMRRTLRPRGEWVPTPPPPPWSTSPTPIELNEKMNPIETRKKTTKT
ncbi:hypothetical protein B0H13DRAFT_2024094 [Mycena leptocephala]|nr:hypothetical protein B0H13DRAFT_2024094 [Mycena leptocephala]